MNGGVGVGVGRSKGSRAAPRRDWKTSAMIKKRKKKNERIKRNDEQQQQQQKKNLLTKILGSTSWLKATTTQLPPNHPNPTRPNPRQQPDRLIDSDRMVAFFHWLLPPSPGTPLPPHHFRSTESIFLLFFFITECNFRFHDYPKEFGSFNLMGHGSNRMMIHCQTHRKGLKCCDVWLVFRAMDSICNLLTVRLLLVLTELKQFHVPFSFQE